MRNRDVAGFSYRHEFHGAAIDERDLSLTVEGLGVHLPPSAARTLCSLLRRPNEALNVSDFSHAMSQSVLQNNVSLIRSALGEALGKRIVNVKNVGYKFVGSVESYPSGRVPASTLSLSVGDEIPNRSGYRLTSQLGANRGVEVWLAEHVSTNNLRVFKFAADTEGLGQLRREFTIWKLIHAQLGESAPIATGLGLQEKAKPFFIDSDYCGLDLRTWARQNNRLVALSPVARRDLTLKIARAVASIHGAGAIHGDLKPSNILIEELPDGFNIRLIDFADAKLVDPKRLERFLVTPRGMDHYRAADHDTSSGTPRYIAPEIWRGAHCTPRSDAFSLGVIAYEILSGEIEKPMVSKWQDDIEHPVLVEEIEKVTRQDADTRSSSDLFANGVESSDKRLADQRKLAIAQRQNRQRKFWAGALFGLFIVVAATAILAMRAISAERAALEERNRATAMAEFLEDVLMSADPRTPGVSPNAPVRDALMRAVELAASDHADDPSLGVPILRLANSIFAGAAAYSSQVDVTQKTIALLTTKYPQGHDEILLEQYRLALILANSMRFEEAEKQIAAADKLFASKTASTPELRLYSSLAKAKTFFVRQRYDESLPHFSSARAAYAEIGEYDPYLLYGIENHYAQSLARVGDFEQALKILESLANPSPDRVRATPVWRVATSKHILAQTLQFAGRYNEADRLMIEAVSEIARIYGKDSFHHLQALNSQAELQLERGRFDLASEGFARVSTSICELRGESSLHCLLTRMNLGASEICLGNLDGGMKLLLATKAAIIAAYPAERDPLAYFDYFLALAHLEAGDNASAREVLSGLTVERLNALAPSAHWDNRLSALLAWSGLIGGDIDNSIKALDRTVAGLRSSGASESEIVKFSRIKKEYAR